MTILRLAHLDLEGLVLDGQVRALRDQFVTHNWSAYLYNGMVGNSTTAGDLLLRLNSTSAPRESL
jgi:argininosuccinate synthase